MKLALKLIAATLIIYIGYGMAENLMAEEKSCLGWVCEAVQCPPDYAVWIPEHGAFLPCDNFEEYIETKDVGLLR